MPEDFDPAWEYFAADPEVAEAAFESEAEGFAALGIESFRLERDGASSGFRFGRSNPDTFVPRQGPERAPGRQGPVNRVCAGCGSVFAPDRTLRKYCSRGCVARPGRPREIPESLDCAYCGKAFRPLRSPQRFCSRRCAGSSKDPIQRRITQEGELALAEMWALGHTIEEMASHFGVHEVTIKKTRRRLGLPPRPAGNHATNRKAPMRECLPDRRRSWTQKAKIPDFNGKPQTFYLTCGEYPDGRLGEIWVEAHKENTFSRGVLGAMARSVSVALQTGTPPAEVVKMMRSLSFPPSGPVTASGSDVKLCTSVADWVAQEIENVYVTGASPRPVTGSVGVCPPAAGEPDSEAG